MYPRKSLCYLPYIKIFEKGLIEFHNFIFNPRSFENLIEKPLFNQPLFSAADDAAYIFPGSRDFATLGSFDKNGLLIRGQKVSYRIEGCDVRGLLKLKFSEPSEPKVFYHYLPAKKDDFGDQPHIVDEVAEEYIEVRHINDYEVRILF